MVGIFRHAPKMRKAAETVGFLTDRTDRPGYGAADRAGQYSIRVNAQWRICFHWTDDGPRDVEIVDYHKRGKYDCNEPTTACTSRRNPA